MRVRTVIVSGVRRQPNGVERAHDRQRQTSEGAIFYHEPLVAHDDAKERDYRHRLSRPVIVRSPPWVGAKVCLQQQRGQESALLHPARSSLTT
jgi:hypothetical protein